jgi:hypothetical protein
MSYTIKDLADLKPEERAEGGKEMPLKLWMKLLECFRKQYPVSYAKAAEEVRVTPATAKRAYEVGNPKLKRPPIRDILMLEAREARTEAEKRFEKLAGGADERVYAAKNIVETKVQEAQLVHGVALSAAALQNVTIKLISGLQPLAQRALGELHSLATAQKVDLKTILGIFKEVRDLARGTTDIVAQKMQLERMLVGDPSAVAQTVPDITPAEAVAEIRASERVLQRLALEDPEGALASELAEAGVPLRLLKGGKG